eukprot:gene12274-25801_t
MSMNADNDIDAYFVAWQDNKPVHILSTIRSTLMKVYNRSMGGTDSFDQRLSYYRPHIKTKSWIPRVFTYFLNASVVNAYIINKPYHEHDKDYQLREFLQQLIFDLLPKNDIISTKWTSPVTKRQRKTWKKDPVRFMAGPHHPFIQVETDKVLTKVRQDDRREVQSNEGGGLNRIEGAVDERARRRVTSSSYRTIWGLTIWISQKDKRGKKWRMIVLNEDDKYRIGSAHRGSFEKNQSNSRSKGYQMTTTISKTAKSFGESDVPKTEAQETCEKEWR